MVITGKTLTAIMEVTRRCNYRCTYCYADAHDRGADMPLDTVRTVIEKLLSAGSHDAVRFIWHGGEPLLRGLDFFREAVALQKACNTQGKTYSNAIQTNGALLSEENLAFFKDHSFRVGLSLDGPQEIHDLTRKRAGDGGTYETTIDRVWLLQKHHLAAGAIATVTACNHRFPDQLYRLFRENNIHLKLGQLRNAGRARSAIGALRLLPEEYGRFAVRLLELWLGDKGGRVMISPFESICRSLLVPGQRPTECVHAGACHSRFVGIAPNGDVYPCGLYLGYDDYRYGNIHNLRGLEEIRRTPAYETLARRQEVVRRLCGDCAFFESCHGGCPFSALTNNGDVLTKDYYCEAFRMVFERVARCREVLEEPEAPGEREAPEEREGPGESEDLKDRLRIICGGGGGGGGGGSYTVHVDEPYSIYVDYTDYEVVV